MATGARTLTIDTGNDLVHIVLQRIQLFVFPRRIRVREHFLDYDPLRCGCVTRPQFSRALDYANIKVAEDEAVALCDYFSERGPRVQKPQDISYDRFCEAVDEVFVTERLEKSPNAQVPSPGSTLQMSFRPQNTANDEMVKSLLLRVALLCRTRGVVMKYQFTDFERGPSASPANVNSRRAGKVTATQFRRQFPFKKELTEQELALLIQRYSTDGGDVHFQALHDDVAETMGTSMPPFPRSDFHKRADPAEWDHDSMDPVSKLRSKVVEKRVRLYEFFQDFDALRKGFCTQGQLKTVFAVLSLDKDVTKETFEKLCGRYNRDDGMFCYVDFVRDIDSAFTLQGLEKSPTTTIAMPDSTSTLSARRNRMNVSTPQKVKIEELEERIRFRVRVRRTLMKPAFQDMDPVNRGLVTRNQFSRCMWMLGFELDESAIALLASVYCDRGNHNDFNYLDFCKACDPSEAQCIAAMQAPEAVSHDLMPNRYFDLRGIVQPLSRPHTAHVF